MTETEFLQQISQRWPRTASDAEPTSATLALVDEAVTSFPASARLWTMRGDLLQLGHHGSEHGLREIERCYRRAIEADPRHAPAYDELGRFLASMRDNRRKAKRFLDKARRLRRSAAAAERPL